MNDLTLKGYTMAGSSGPVAKLLEKAKRNALKHRMGAHRALTARNSSTFAEKQQAFLKHQRAIHGWVHNGVVIQEGGINPGRVFAGTGLPDEGYKLEDRPNAKFNDVTPKAKSLGRSNAAKVAAPVATPSVAKWSRRGGFASR